MNNALQPQPSREENIVHPVPSGQVVPFRPYCPSRLTHETQTFLSTMASDEREVHLRLINEKDKKQPTIKLTLKLPLHGLSDEVGKIKYLNSKGYGVFWVVNEGGQKAADINTIRALFVDYDGNDPQSFMNILEKLPAPHIIVESSSGKYHVYWKCKGVPLAEFEALQQGLIAQLGTDKSIHDLPRVMRMPGFLHQKGVPFMVRIVKQNAHLPAYTLEQCRKFAKPLKAEKGEPQQRTPRQTKLTAQATPPAGSNADILAFMNSAAQNLPSRAEVEAEQRTYDLACITSAVAFLAKAGHAENHDDWQAVGADLKGCTRGVDGAEPALTDEEAFDLFVQFSEAAPNGAAHDLEDRWENIGTDIFGCGALLDRAKQAGWEAPPHPKSAIARQIAEVGDWVKLLARPKRGNPYSHLLNVTTALAHAPQLKGVFRYDQMAQCTVQTRRIGAKNPYPNGLVEVTDRELSSLIQLLNNAGMVAVSPDTAARAVELVAYENAFHPLQEYLTRLKWDGTQRLDTWMPKYLGTEDNEYTRRVGRMFLIALCARAMEPGVKMDTMLVLTGKQGMGKSTALAILGGEWFTDQIPDLRNHERLSMCLRGVWIAELAELSATRKSDAELLKHTITAREQRYRPPYARKDVIEPRTCVFVGTTNADTFLNDPTGGRRFWPVTVGEIDLDGLTCDRNQLFAEAMQAYQAGEKWWPQRSEEAALFVPMQEAAQQEDPWLEPIRAYLGRIGGNKDFTCTASSILSEAVGIGRDKISPADCRRASAILQAEGMEMRRSKGNRVFHYPKT